MVNNALSSSIVGSVETLRTQFSVPPDEYTPVPFWFWNGKLDKAELKRQLEEMVSQGVYETIIHARNGLEIEYLSEEWFDRVDCVLREGHELGIRFWIYDEHNFPNGYAGGKVLAADPSYRARHLLEVVLEPNARFNLTDGDVLVAVYRETVSGKLEPIPIDEREEKTSIKNNSPSSSLYVYVSRYGNWNPAHSNEWYVDLLNREATNTFIQVTHEEYFKRFGEYFATTIKGFFTDEPGFYNNVRPPYLVDVGSIPWTPRFPEEFFARKGYSLVNVLPHLWRDLDSRSEEIRIDYWDVVSKLFAESFFKPLYDWCESHGVALIGHVNDEEYTKYLMRGCGHFFLCMEYLHMPGVDKIKRNKDRITEKLGSSAAHMSGKRFCTSETYGTFGWSLTLEEMKETLNWQYVRGINTIIPHAFYYSIEGDRVREAPPSQFFQNPYWKYFYRYAQYVKRLGLMLSNGVHIPAVGVYYPSLTAWAHLTPDDNEELEKVDFWLKEVSYLLIENQYDFDYIDDDTLCRRALVDGSILRINGEKFDAIVLPFVDRIPLETARVLRQFVRNGGTLLVACDFPVAGANSDESYEIQDISKELLSYGEVCSQVEGRVYVANGKKDVLLNGLRKIKSSLRVVKNGDCVEYLHRRFDDGDVYFLTNKKDIPVEVELELLSAGNCEVWDPDSGNIYKHHGITDSDGIHTTIHLNPLEGKFIVLSRNNRTYDELSEMNMPEGVEVCRLDGLWNISLDGESISHELSPLASLGYPTFSGEVLYTKEYEFTCNLDGDRLYLELGDVRETSEVRVNGTFLGAMPWRPHIYDVTDVLNEGYNRIEIIVTTTLENQIHQSGKPSGLLGPVRIFK